jgi:hypothetical protein
VAQLPKLSRELAPVVGRVVDHVADELPQRIREGLSGDGAVRDRALQVGLTEALQQGRSLALQFSQPRPELSQGWLGAQAGMDVGLSPSQRRSHTHSALTMWASVVSSEGKLPAAEAASCSSGRPAAASNMSALAQDP